MKNIYKLALFFPLLVTSCSTNNDSTSNSEQSTNYDSSWIEEISEEENPNTVKLSKNYYQILAK